MPSVPFPRPRLAASIWVLGVVSLLMDASSELVHSLLPVLMATTLGASVATIGLLEGLAEATSSIVKMFSGVMSDWLGRRKALVVIGYGLAALSKPLFPLAPSIGWIFTARVVDRIGKGIRGAPRDALIADITPPELRGAAFGLRQALDSVGAALGPLLAIALMLWFANDIRSVLWIAALPACLALALLVAGVHEPEREVAAAPPHAPFTRASLYQLPRRYWWVVAVGAVFTLARFSEAFLILRAQDVGISIAYAPAVMIAMNVVYAAAAYPAGRLADHVRTRTLLVWGLALLAVADVALAVATGPALVLAGACCWGLHMALTQGLLSKLVADTASPALRGSAFGFFHLVTGAALFAASVIAGALWTTFGPSAAFVAGAVFSAAAATGVLTSTT